MAQRLPAFGVARCSVWRPQADLVRPDVDFVPPLLRRRLSRLSAMALFVANQALRDERDVPVVLASRHGELVRTADILESLADGEAPSPTAFSLSVHNTATGLLGMIRQERAPGSALSAGSLTLAMGLLETVALAAADGGKALLIYADEQPPALYAEAVTADTAPFALAALVDANAADFTLTHAVETGCGSLAEQGQALAALFERRQPQALVGNDEQCWRVEARARAA